MPACLPEQLLCALVGCSPRRVMSFATSSLSELCGPHTSSDSLEPDAASMRRASSTWRGSPLCEAHWSASASSPNPNRGGAPLVIDRNRRDRLAHERQKATLSGSPL